MNELQMLIQCTKNKMPNIEECLVQGTRKK